MQNEPRNWQPNSPGLLRQQIEALEEATFIRMNREKAEAHERRSQRIAELKAMLGQLFRKFEEHAS